MARSRVPARLEGLGGVAGWDALAAATSRSAVSRAVASGAVVRALPGVLALPALLDGAAGAAARQRAALLFSGEPSALSHTTALARWGLPVAAGPSGSTDPAVHVLVPHHRRRTTPLGFPVQVVLHRSRTEPLRRVRDGMEVVGVARAVVDGWPLLPVTERRAPALVAVRRRLVTVPGLADAVAARPQAPGVQELRELVARLAAGCRSELELWGYEQVFLGPRFGDLHRQVRVVVAGQTSYLDAYDAASALAIELDGRRYHDSPRDRERDIARDLRLATVGVQTVRFSHQRLTDDPAGCREEAWAVMSVRRAQLAGRPLPRVVVPPGTGAEAALVLPRTEPAPR